MKIRKRDGQTEDFDQEKITRVMVAAGLSEAEAIRVAKQVGEWLAVAAEPEFTTFQLREKIIEVVRSINPHVADLYAWYEKGKDQ